MCISVCIRRTIPPYEMFFAILKIVHGFIVSVLWSPILVCMYVCLCICRAGVVCAFVTNQLVHDSTKAARYSDQQPDDDSKPGLIESFVIAADGINSYQETTANVSTHLAT